MSEYPVLWLLVPFIVAGIAAAIPWRVREELWWSFVLVVLIGAAVGAAYTLLSGGPLFFPTPHD